MEYKLTVGTYSPRRPNIRPDVDQHSLQYGRASAVDHHHVRVHEIHLYQSLPVLEHDLDHIRHGHLVRVRNHLDLVHGNDLVCYHMVHRILFLNLVHHRRHEHRNLDHRHMFFPNELESYHSNNLFDLILEVSSIDFVVDEYLHDLPDRTVHDHNHDLRDHTARDHRIYDLFHRLFYPFRYLVLASIFHNFFLSTLIDFFYDHDLFFGDLFPCGDLFLSEVLVEMDRFPLSDELLLYAFQLLLIISDIHFSHF